MVIKKRNRSGNREMSIRNRARTAEVYERENEMETHERDRKAKNSTKRQQ